MKTLNLEKSKNNFAEFALSSVEMTKVRGGGDGDGDGNLDPILPPVKI